MAAPRLLADLAVAVRAAPPNRVPVRAPHDIRVLAGEGSWHVPRSAERDLVSHSPWHPTLMMSLTVDGPELQLETAHLLDLVCQVLHEDLQLGSLVLEVREFITG